MLTPSQGGGTARTFTAVLITFVIAALGVTASFAFADGPLAMMLGEATKPTRSDGKQPQILLAKAVRVSSIRHRHRHHSPPSKPGTPTPRASADTTAPQTSITSGPPATTKSTSASFSLASSEANSTFECKREGGNWAPCVSPKSYSNLSKGSYLFAVRATDAAGNTDATPIAQTWTVEASAPPPPPDTTAPQTSITSGPPATTKSTSASFSLASSEANSTFECKRDGGSWSGCISPKTYSGLSVGSHQFSVRATDAAGNTDATPIAQTWTVEASAPPPPPDTTAPQTSITSGPPATTKSTSASFSLASSEANSTFECKRDGGSWSGCISPKTYSGLSVGSHLFSVRATDKAGNTDTTPATQSWTVEGAAPPPPPGNCTAVVSSVSSAQTSLSSASPGSVVCLADGSYGKLSLNATKSAPGVTVRAEHPGKATIDGASMQGARLTLARFNITNEVVVQPGTTGMAVDHNRITGGYMGVNAGPTSSTQVNDVEITGNEFVGPFGEDAIRLNRYHDSDGDGVGVLIEGNEFTGIRENGNHSDCLQTVWVGDHLVYRKNYLHDNRCQGFFVKDQASAIVGITVENNLFVRNNEPCGPPLTSCGQPSYFQVFGPYQDFTMRRNTIWQGDVIAVFQNGSGPGTVIESNVVTRFWTSTDLSGAIYRDNTRCKREASGGSWPSQTPGEIVDCSPAFANPAVDDLRLTGSNRGVDWAPSEQHFGF